MTARLVQEWVSPTIDPVAGHDAYVHCACTWVADTEDEALQAARNWCWDKIGSADGSFIRAVPETNNQNAIWYSRARVSVRIFPKEQGFGALDVNRLHIIG